MSTTILEPAPTSTAMRRVALIYNPASGQRPEQRNARIARAIAVLENAGILVQAIATESPASAAAQAQQAVREGCDTILACGGDGTVHETLQGLVGQTAALGVIPMGTANALAANLGIPSSAAKAARVLLEATPVRVSVGRVFYRDAEGGERSRYFIVAAGVGVDAHFFSRLDSSLKQRFGYAAYLIEAFRLMATHTFPMFSATLVERDTGGARTVEASQLLAVRISNFGSLVQNLVPGAELNNRSLRVVAIKTQKRSRYLRFMLAVMLRRHRYGNTIELVKASRVDCTDLPGAASKTFVEADGELLGCTPVRIEVAPETLNLLIPSKALSRITRR